jgi:hypothetical protein
MHDRGVHLLSALPLGCGDDNKDNANDPAMIAQGKETFRNDTFGDEALWTDTLQMHTVISTAVSPKAALGLGLKVDADALPPNILSMVDLDSPATTVALLKMNARGWHQGPGRGGASGDQLMRVGITCALCHSTVDDSVMPGIGHRVDGAPNRELDPGAIIAASPAVTEQQKLVYMSWGKGKYDPRYNVDGMNDPVFIPPAYGLKDSPHATFTGDGDIRYWNNYVAVTQMGGQGTFVDDRIGVNKTLPAGTEDLVKPKLDGLRAVPVQPGRSRRASGHRYERYGRQCRQRAQRVRPALRQLPQGRRAHRGHAARAGQHRDGPDVRGPQREQEVPDHAAAGPRPAPAVLPRRKRGDAVRGGRSLRPGHVHGPDGDREDRPDHVPRVALVAPRHRRGVRLSFFLVAAIPRFARGRLVGCATAARGSAGGRKGGAAQVAKIRRSDTFDSCG